LKKKTYYLQTNDNVRSLAPLFRGKVETNTRGIVQQGDEKGRFVLVNFPEAKVSGWVRITDVEIIPEKFKEEPKKRFKPRHNSKEKSAKEKQALDQFGKKYLQNYLKGTGYGEQIMRVACNDVEKVMKSEDSLTPAELRNAYNELSTKYKDQGGFKFVRAVRQEIISSGILKRK